MKLHFIEIAKEKSLKTGLAKKLLESLYERYEIIFTNPTMKAAIFLDPRFRSEITRDENCTNTAKETIIEIHKRLQLVKSHEIGSNETAVESDESFGIQFDPDQAINDYFGRSANKSTHLSDIDAMLDAFDPPMLSAKDSVLEYWNSESAKTDYDDLREVALAIYGIPPTEVQCERNFSTLKFVMSDQRRNLSTGILEDILCIYLNADIYHKVCADQLEELKKGYSESD